MHLKLELLRTITAGQGLKFQGSLTKAARVYNGEKTISLTSGAGKTG